MIKLLYAHVCESAFTTLGSNNFNIIGIFENINAKNFPAIHPKFSIVTCIQGDTGNYQQIIIITNQQTGQEITRISGQSDIIVQNGKAIFVGNFIMTPFPSPNKYLVNIFVNNNKIGETEFNVA